MKVKELQKTVNITWSPEQIYPIYLAAGSAAQQLDSGGNSLLEIYSINLNEPGYDLTLKGSLPSQHRFQKLCWSPTGNNDINSYGLIVGGCEGGHLMIYSAAKMLDGEEALIAQQDAHTGAVRGLDFNPFQTNLLASAASESEIFVWDLNNTSTHMTPGSKTQPLEDVQNVAWNRQVQHILASVFSSRCVIWDLRKNEQIIKLSDTQSRVRWRAVQWHPDVATQIWLASEEDQASFVQMWDLRYATAPAKTMQIHQRGVLGMSWCPKDSDMIVSCGKDNRIYCWNPNTSLAEGEILSEVAVTNQWYSDVQWCPRNPALIASSSLDGNVSIYSLFGGAQEQVQTSNKIADSFPNMDQFDQSPIPQQATQVTYSDPSKPPKWMKKHSGVKFGFGGKLLSFNNQSKSVQISQLEPDMDLVDRATQVEESLTNTNFSEFCRNKANETSNQDDRYLWYFLKANFELNPKEEMLNLLGYNTDDMENKFSEYSTKNEINDLDVLTDCIGGLNTENDNHDKKEARKTAETNIQLKMPSGDDLEVLISEAIITGNLEAAVELCFETGRSAEALIIASTAGIEFLSKIQDRFLKKQNSELSNVISALVTRDWMDLVSRCTIDSWKKALVATLKHNDRKIADICEKLGDRLLAEKASIETLRNGILCYVCAGAIEKIISAWYQLKKFEKQDCSYELNNNEIQDLAEVVMLLSKSLEKQGVAIEPEGNFAEFVSTYGELLADHGALNTAIAYVFALGPSTHPKLDDLRDRFNNFLNPDKLGQHSSHQKSITQIHQENYYSKQPVRNQTSFNTGLPQWNAASPAVPLSPQVAASVTMIAPLQQNHSQIFTLPVAQSQIKPPTAAQINESLMHPPRPSSVSSQGSSTTLSSRTKYILDPSVSSCPQYSSSNYGGSYNPTQAIPPNNSNGMSFNQNQSPYQPQPTLAGPIVSPNNFIPLSTMQPLITNYVSGVPPIETSTSNITSPPMPIQRNPTPPPGWNDPPVLKSNKQQNKRAEPLGSAITHPLFGADPNQNSYVDPNTHYHNPTVPPIPNVDQNVASQNSSIQNQHNNNQSLGQATFQATASNMFMQPQQQISYAQTPAPAQQRLPEISKEKPPLPEEFIYMQTVFEELKSQCLSTASDPRTKRKFVDVTKRLENLYDCLRHGRLTSNTVEALNQIVQFIQIGDYGNALATHTSIAFGTDFAQTASFMPGIKVLIQSAADLKVYLR